MLVRATLAELEAEAPRLRESGWLRVTVPLAARDPDINGKVRRLLPNAVSVGVELPEADAPSGTVSVKELRPTELYCAYHRAEHGAEPEGALVEAFGRLWAEAESP